MTLRSALAMLGLTAACAPAQNTVVVARLELAQVEQNIEVTLRPSPGARINALVPPTLELGDGGRIQLTGVRETADTSYFSGQLTAVLPGKQRRVVGTLRLSVCPSGERACRVIVHAVDMTVPEAVEVGYGGKGG